MHADQHANGSLDLGGNPGQSHRANQPRALPLNIPIIRRSVSANRHQVVRAYQVRLTAQSVSPDAKGSTAGLERWVEFVQGKQVKGREVVSIFPQAEIVHVQKDAPPQANSAKVEMLKGGDYMRLWINRDGSHYLVHFPT